MMLSEDVVGSHLSESRRKITQLLEHPVARGVPSDVEVQKPSVLNHEEAIQELESQPGNREEIKGGDRFPVIGGRNETIDWRDRRGLAASSEGIWRPCGRKPRSPASAVRRGFSALPIRSFRAP